MTVEVEQALVSPRDLVDRLAGGTCRSGGRWRQRWFVGQNWLRDPFRTALAAYMDDDLIRDELDQIVGR